MAPRSEISKRVAACKAKLTSVTNRISSDQGVEPLKTRLGILEQAWNEFDQAYDQLLLDSEEEAMEELMKIRQGYEDKFVLSKATAEEKITAETKTVETNPIQVNVSKSAELPLPRPQLPRFGGKYEEWVEFKDTFLTAVHERTDISKGRKLQLLKSCLYDSAKRIIQSVPISEDGYDKAWETIQRRYENKRLLIATYVKRFIAIPAVSRASASQLRAFIDTVTDCVSSLELLGYPVQGILSLYLLAQKLDSETRFEWESSLKDDDIPTFEIFVEFLEKQTKSLEVMSIGSKAVLKQQARTSFTHLVTQDSCVKCSDNHAIYRCADFIKLPVDQRRALVKTANLCFKCLRSGHRVQQCRFSQCKRCKGAHNTLLHLEREKDVEQDAKPESMSVSNFGQSNSEVILATARITIKDGNGELQECRAIIDGGSQSSFISEECVQRLRLRRRSVGIRVGVLGGGTHRKIHGMVSVQAASRIRPSATFLLQAFILPRITSDLPSLPFEIEDCAFLERDRLTLADPAFNKPAKIDLLIGGDCYPALKLGILEPLPQQELYKQDSILGGIIRGRVTRAEDHVDTTRGFHVNVESDQQLKAFWELEEVPEARRVTEEERRCEEFFERTVLRHKNGRFVVRLPFRDIESTQRVSSRASRAIAESRFYQLEKRLMAHPEVGELYGKEIRDYITQGHMQKCPSVSECEKQFYLPHHAVYKESSLTTKMRIVFDASAQSKENASLNSCLMTGPTIQDELFDLLIRFRTYNIALTADIEKMYRQIFIHESDRDYQRILWRENASGNLCDYRLTTVTFGVSSAPYLAVKCLQMLAREFQDTMPRGAKALARDFYVDDLITGAHTLVEIKQIQQELSQILNSAGFNLRKWASNCAEFMRGTSSQSAENGSTHTFVVDDCVKTLGIVWKRHEDVFTFQVNEPSNHHITKRSVLSDISKLFDPMGWIAPFTVRAKMLIQNLWFEGISWDECLPSDLSRMWLDYCREFKILETIRINRCIFVDSARVKRREFHGFSDASERAYAAVVFIRTIYEDNSISSGLLCARTKVASRGVSLPRLELCGAQLLTKLIKKLMNTLGFSAQDVIAWSDSTIVLAWLRKHPNNWKTFVSNRVSFIQEVIPPSQWRHVSSKENPADLASRGVGANTLRDNKLWWVGPEWLTNEKIPNPQVQFNKQAESEMRKRVTSLLAKQTSDWISRFSSYSKLIRVTAHCRRFIKNSRNVADKKLGALTGNEIASARLCVIKFVQGECFAEEIELLRNRKELSKQSRIVSLSPFMDADGVLRVGGRLANRRAHFDQKHPILLPKNHAFVELLIRNDHITNLHAGPQLLLAVLRQRYWILGCRDRIRYCVHKCVTCLRLRARVSDQIMGALPAERVTPARPFSKCGVDYAGPLNIKSSSRRGSKTERAYICIFVCFVTRAVHLELVSSLTTEAFLAALKRFVSRRGWCSDIYSDCGTNFVGADRELRELLKHIKEIQESNGVTSFFSNQEVNWHFNPPGAPHFGGLWEAGVKSTKFHLRRILGQALLTFEEMYTALTLIEACLNSRPLYPLSSDPGDLSALTPAHFLIGDTMTSVPEHDFTDKNENRLSRWQRVQQMSQHFWKRWQSEYLPQLQSKLKWTRERENIEVNDLVIIKQESLPPGQWLLGRVAEVHPGSDGGVRVVTLQTKNGRIKRCINKICKLPKD